MKSGILIFAVGHPYYGRMAFNLAATIKAMDAEFPVVVITDGEKKSMGHLDDDQKALFTDIIPVPRADTMGAGAKLLSYDVTPFDQTLVIDADNLWLPGRQPADFMEAMKGKRFAAIKEGHIDFGTIGPKKEKTRKTAAKKQASGKKTEIVDPVADEPETSTDDNQLNAGYPTWADPREIRDVYGVKRVYQLRSETIYFEKSKPVQSMFEKALEVFQDPKVTTAKWGSNGVADELALNIATSVQGLDVPDDFNPTWWAAKAGGRVPAIHQIARDFWMFSTGGNYANNAIKKTYNDIAAFAFRKIGQPFRFELKSKISVLPERSKY